jgi:hypothetical protein
MFLHCRRARQELAGEPPILTLVRPRRSSGHPKAAYTVVGSRSINLLLDGRYLQNTDTEQMMNTTPATYLWHRLCESTGSNTKGLDGQFSAWPCHHSPQPHFW